ncbi:membrane protein [Candidatus Mancarchaeum acidiphilum]|uniref:Membrane protein n=1 Tax=Candidatus Mancarchaeum acidiphilum TaxID=1920749 RepID=A0A218NNH7_9ARCH|nr:hypothetical protein [Candidatus Mancarchaeum acidiphilum]ASI14021.1 membrane protein [Candidatus Mancarchaeum acidiphilum]
MVKKVKKSKKQKASKSTHLSNNNKASAKINKTRGKGRPKAAKKGISAKNKITNKNIKKSIEEKPAVAMQPKAVKKNISESNVKVPEVNIKGNMNLNEETKKKEPLLIIKPASHMGGLDYLHISLIILVVILIALLVVMSTFKVVKTVTTAKVCQYGIVNSTCVQPKYNSSQALTAAETVIAGYARTNSSLSLLPYYIEPNDSSVSYLNNSKEWLVVMPYKDPVARNETLNISILLYSSNLTLVEPFSQLIPPPSPISSNTAVGSGAIKLANKVACNTTEPVPAYYITDPYAYNALTSLSKIMNETSSYKGKINTTYYFIFTGYSQSLYPTYGVNKTQLLGRYLACASSQPNFGMFVNDINKNFNYAPMSNSTLTKYAELSFLNMTQMKSCMYNITDTMDYQAELAKYYNVTQTPEIILNCQYETIPEKFNSAANYTLSQLNSSK